MKKKRKDNRKHRTIVAVLILLSVTFGLLLASNLFSHDSNSYFARIRVAIKKKVQIVYNYNLFDGSKINNSGIKEYDSDKQEITFDGKLEGTHINLGTLNVKLKKGERYRVTVNYLSGSYDKNGEPKFIFELQKDNEYYTDRKNGTHYVFEMLPTKKDKPIDKVLTITDEVLDATNIIYRIYQENEVEFKNYKIQVSITKLESKIGVAGEKYGKLPTPEKDGYEFLGWYDSISGGKKITETNTILKKYNHPLYAHWKKEKPKEPLRIYYLGLGRYDGYLITGLDTTLFIDGGYVSQGKKAIEFIKNLGITKIDGLIGSHLHDNHIDAHKEFINQMEIGRVYYSDEPETCLERKTCVKSDTDTSGLVKLIKEKNIPMTILKPGLNINIGNLTFDIVWPETLEKGGRYPENYNSLNMILKYGKNKFYFSGDHVAANEILKKYNTDVLDVDIFKYPHHGQESVSSDFISTISPKYVMVPHSTNKIPSSSANALKKENAEVFILGSNSYVLAESDGTNLTVTRINYK